jgi:hypothetical protein
MTLPVGIESEATKVDAAALKPKGEGNETRRPTVNKKQLMMRAVTIAAAGAIALVDLVPAVAAPVLSSTAMVKSTAPDMLGQVRWRGGRRGFAGVGIGLGVLGAVAGIAGARSYDYGPAYYGGGPYYGGASYGTPYYGSPYYGDRYSGGYAYHPGPEIPLGMIGGVTATSDYGAVAYSPGRCWITTDSDRGYGYFGRCYR